MFNGESLRGSRDSVKQKPDVSWKVTSEDMEKMNFSWLLERSSKWNFLYLHLYLLSLSFHWLLVRRAWVHLLYSLLSDIYIHWWDLPWTFYTLNNPTCLSLLLYSSCFNPLTTLVTIMISSNQVTASDCVLDQTQACVQSCLWSNFFLSTATEAALKSVQSYMIGAELFDCLQKWFSS